MNNVDAKDQCCDKELVYCGTECCDVTLQDIDGILYFLRGAIRLDGMHTGMYFTRRLKEDKTSNLKKLDNVRWVLEEERKTIALGHEPCLCCEELQSLTQGVRDMIGHECAIPDLRNDLVTDNSNYNNWVLNSQCISYEEWEKCMYGFAREFNITIKKSDACNFVFDIVKEAIPCDFAYALKFYQKECELDYKIEVDKKECKQEYEILTKKHECNLSYKVYTQLRSCNLSYEIIALGAKCGAEWSIDTKNKCPLITIEAKTYSLDDVDLSNLDLNNKLVSCNTNLNELHKHLKASYSG